ncbi:hypothetical protein BWL13_02456 [Microbacterium oleivorans]|nr:hypothetical protein BWL13_02456 [Microbacterium oleivorans]
MQLTSSATSSSDRARSVRGTPIALGVTWFLLLLIPQNFTDLQPIWTIAVQGATALGAALGVISLARRSPRLLAQLLIVGAILCLVVVLASGQFLPVAFMFAPVIAGVSLGLSSNTSAQLVVLVAAFAAIVGSVVVDLLVGGPITSGLFGTPHRIGALTESRPRGFLGQPVPSGVAIAALSTSLIAAVQGFPSASRRRFWTVATLAIGFASIIATGTRSALILLVLGIALVLWRGPRHTAKSNKLGSVATVVALAALAIALWPRISANLGGLRAFSFDTLSGSESAINREYAWTILGQWAQHCDDACKLVGAGPRGLQLELLTFAGYNGLATVDNFFVTLLWDFGILGLVAVALGLILTARYLFISRASTVGAAPLIVLATSGIFFDTFYTAPLVALLGLFIGLTLSNNPTRSDKIPVRRALAKDKQR